MEQHPVPQNVTTFQFRLIGDMTLKQFGYLIGGAIGAYILYKLPLPFFFTWPLAVLSAAGGFGFAFVPIEERPMDVWVLSFIKSIYNPTQYLWSRKTAPAPAAPPPTIPVLQAPTMVAPPPFTAKKGLFTWILDLWEPKTQTAPLQPPAKPMDFSPPPIVRPAQNIEKKLKEEQHKESVLEDKLKKLTSELGEKDAAESRIVELQKQLTELMGEREKMMQELEGLRKQSTPPPMATTSTQIPAGQSPLGGATPTIQIIQPGRAEKVGLPRLTTFPNIVTGIVKDKEKNLLPGVLVTVKDKEGVPLRALKTNRLGQFAASTQLPNGTYLIEIEDPRLRFTFDRAQITLNGTIVPALEIFAKTEKEITRAKLEKELFGTPNI